MSGNCVFVYTVSVCVLAVVYGKALEDVENIDFRMKDNQPQQMDTYSCTPMKMSDKPLFLTGFVPHADKQVAHHMLLYGCEEPGQQEGTWDCGEMSAASVLPVCESGMKIIYAWASNAPDMMLPEGVGFKVGGDSGIKWLVLQIHYLHVDAFLPPLNGVDNSGITMVTTHTEQPKLAATYLLVTGGVVPAHSTVYMEAACQYKESTVLHPFAFRTHTHQHGKVSAGYRVRDGEWSEIGRIDPQKPQYFYNVTDPNLTVKQDDFLAARCTMVNDEDRDVPIGMTHKDEMCNFYIMYWVDGQKVPEENNCMTDGPPNYHWSKTKTIQSSNAPDQASVIPGTDNVIPETVSKTVVSQSSSSYSTGDVSDDELQELMAEYMSEMQQAEQEDEALMRRLYGELEGPSSLEEAMYPEIPPEPEFERELRAQDQYSYDEIRNMIEEYYDSQ